MATITEDYVSFEIAKLLKEKGFNEFCLTSYNTFLSNHKVEESKVSRWGKANQIYRPTLQRAMKWLREMHNIFIEISVSIDINGDYHYSYSILNRECKYVRKGYTNFDWSYEQACETAIRYCLENLI